MNNPEQKQIDIISEVEQQEDETLQLAENTEVEDGQKEAVENEFSAKRELLQKTKIASQFSSFKSFSNTFNRLVAIF